jgi:endonuclease YncB( thermonuclease family)
MFRGALIVRIVIITLLLYSLAYAAPSSFTARVIGISDGDTITVLKNKTRIKIRLHGIDCPEFHQAFGNRARRFTSKKVYKKTVTIRPVDTDRYGRTVAWVYIDGKNLNEEIVRAGLARHYRRYSNDGNLAAAELEARKKRAGIWSIPPAKPGG